jgi:hypothetical protein
MHKQIKSIVEEFESLRTLQTFSQRLGAAITTLHFLCNLKRDPETRGLHYACLERLDREKHSSLLGLFISYKENKGL